MYERGNSRIQVFDAALNHVAMWGNGAVQTEHLFPVESEGRFRMVTIGPNTCESLLCAVRVYDAEGNALEGMASVKEMPLSATWKGDVARDTVYVVNVHEPEVQSYTMDGESVVSFSVKSPSTTSLEAEAQQYDSREAFLADQRELFSQPYSTIRDIFVYQNYVLVQHENKNMGSDAFYFMEKDEGTDFSTLIIRRAELEAEAW